MTRAVYISVLITLATWLGPVPSRGASRPAYTLEQILRAIRLVESGDQDNGPAGDGGRAIGPYQIHREYWIDGGGKSSTYRTGASRAATATPIVHNYLSRYQPEAYRQRDWKMLATLHHCGPAMTHPTNRDYLNKIQRALRSISR